SAASGFRDAIRRHDWSRAWDDLARAIETVTKAYQQHGLPGGIAAGASALGNVVGGRAGRALSSAGSAGSTALMATGNPYIALAAAAVAGLTELLRGKPSNQGAGYSLVTGEFSGKSRTAETERAAKSAADIISGGMDILRDAGAQLTATVHGLVIGTRDLSQIYLTNGRTVTAAVGDAAAAAEAGLLAMLESATFADEAQGKLVKSMMAAGK